MSIENKLKDELRKDVEHPDIIFLPLEWQAEFDPILTASAIGQTMLTRIQFADVPEIIFGYGNGYHPVPGTFASMMYKALKVSWTVIQLLFFVFGVIAFMVITRNPSLQIFFLKELFLMGRGQ